ncbi:transcription antitermination factor NusB [Pseudokineococcus basanitobsidens]|uniref:Transcription antitermination factor NusB n=1 Tax=Pseudokineococcus basanitobsidens TaxID=1926649 RepID=A0ABU8RI20_9ACTN
MSDEGAGDGPQDRGDRGGQRRPGVRGGAGRGPGRHGAGRPPAAGRRADPADGDGHRGASGRPRSSGRPGADGGPGAASGGPRSSGGSGASGGPGHARRPGAEGGRGGAAGRGSGAPRRGPSSTDPRRPDRGADRAAPPARPDGSSRTGSTGGAGSEGTGAGAGAPAPRSGPARQRWSTAKPSQRSRGGGPAREVALDVLTAVREDDAYANLVLPGLLRRARLDARDAALATELAYGTLRGRGLYDAVLATCSGRPLAQVDPPLLDALRLGVHQLLATRVPAHAAVSQTVGLVRTRIGAGPGGFANAVLRRVAERDRDAWLAEVAPEEGGPDGGDTTERLAVAHSHPAWVVRALREALVAHGRDVGELEALLRADNAAPEVVLAARPGLATPDELVAQARDVVLRSTPGAWSPVAVRLDEGDPGALPAVREGRARVQDEGSQLAALALAAAPLEGRDERWLDLAAGPGGKAALLAAVGAGRGASLVAVEVSEHRARLVEQAVAAVAPGGTAVEVRTADGREVGDDEPGAYDRVLVDAPCTGLGALRRRPEARWRRQPSDLAGLGPLQRGLLDSALAAVRVGGVVAYVTCSPHPAETLAVVGDAVRRRCGTVELLDAPAALDAAAGSPVPGTASGGPDATGPEGTRGRTAQLWPHAHGTDAMFVALLRRVS